mgnify:CR=1 FL=1
MKACELLISKPGGLSSTEAAVSCTPLIHINPIPGCESKNMEYFSSRGMSLAVHSLQKELLPAVEQLLQPSSARQMLACQQQNISESVTLPSSLLTAPFRLCQNNAEFLYIKKSRSLFSQRTGFLFYSS